MKVDRLLGYLQGRFESTPEQKQANAVKGDERAQASRGVAVEAVKVSSDFGRGTTTDASREARVAELKSQVQSGSYKQPDPRTLARVLVRDLF